MDGYEVQMILDETNPKSVEELAGTLDVPEDEIERRIDYLESHGFAERTAAGIQDTGKSDNFEPE